MIFSILTLFPEMFSGPFSYSILKKAIDKKLLEIRFVNIRDFAADKHKTVDDTPYGGGLGMLMRVDVLYKALEASRCRFECKEKVILLDPKGKNFNQGMAKKLSSYDHLIIICGHYEGFDERIRKFVDQSISVGDFVQSGGEIPAMVITDAVARLVKGVLKREATEIETIPSKYHEYPQYTKPQEFMNLKVPKVLLSGNHEKITGWRIKHAKKINFND